MYEQVKELIAAFFETHKTVIVVGPAGSGKFTVSEDFVREVTGEVPPVIFMSVLNDGEVSDNLRKLLNDEAQFIIFDDFDRASKKNRDTYVHLITNAKAKSLVVVSELKDLPHYFIMRNAVIQMPYVKPTPFDNERRTRYYGLRIGDLVKYLGYEGEVTAYGFMDNNRVEIKTDKGPVSAVAEWCTILTRVENRSDFKLSI